MFEDNMDYESNPNYLSNWSLDYLNNIDTSQYPFPNTLWHVKPTNEIILKTTVMVLVGLCGIFCNSIILIILIKNSWLWTASNCLIGNMALMDLLTLILCPWFMLVRDFYQNFVLRHFGCRFEGFMQSTFLISGICAVMLVSYDRLAAAALTPDARVTKSAAPKLIIASWFLSIALSLPWILKREFMTRQWLDHLEMFCVEEQSVFDIYWHFTLTLLVWIPFSVMVVTYGTIMYRIECSARELSTRGGGQAVARARGKAIRISACVLLVTVICRLPYSVLLYWREKLPMEINSVSGSFDAMWFASNFLIYLNCAINPLIYGFTNIRFRKAMDRTPGVACFRFGAWCCVCNICKKKHRYPQIHPEDKNTEKIFVIEDSPKPKKKVSHIIKHILHINKDTIELSVPKVEEVTTKPTKITPLKAEHI